MPCKIKVKKMHCKCNRHEEGNHIMSKYETNFVHSKRRITFLNIDSERRMHVVE